jgi:hypothetical protein
VRFILYQRKVDDWLYPELLAISIIIEGGRNRWALMARIGREVKYKVLKHNPEGIRPLGSLTLPCEDVSMDFKEMRVDAVVWRLKLGTWFFEYCNESSTASVVYWSEFLAIDPEARVRFRALPDFLRSSGSGTGSTQPHEYN